MLWDAGSGIGDGFGRKNMLVRFLVTLFFAFLVV